MTKIISLVFILTSILVNPVFATDLGSTADTGITSYSEYIFPVVLEKKSKHLSQDFQRIKKATFEITAKQDLNQTQKLEVINVLENLKQENASYLTVHLNNSIASIAY